MTLIKLDLSLALYDKGLLLQRESQEFVKLVLEEIKQELEKGNNVKISGFGKFSIVQKKERIGRNPRTKEEYTISARKVVTWHPGEKLRFKL